MEPQKILNLLNETSDSNFVTKKEKLSMNNQMEITIQEMKLSILQKH